MKLIMLLMIALFSIPSFAITKLEVAALLKEKNVSLQQLEQKGAQVILGEVTGHNSALPFSKIQVILTSDEAILRGEIDSVDFKGTQQLGNVVAVRFQGQYVLKQDVKAVIVSGQ